MEIVVNPTEENPSTLRALALMLNSIASDRDGGKAPGDSPSAPKPAVVVESPPPAPVVPAAPTAPASTTPAADTPSSEIVTDKAGLPWDERIHSSSKNMNADGTWRYLRGGDVDLRAAVEAELRAKLANTETPPPPPPVADNAGDVPPPPPPPAPAAAADAPPPPPPPVVETQADAAPAGVTAAVVFKRINELKAAKRIDQDGINAALTSVDVESLAAFMKLAKDDAGLPELVLDALNAIAGEE